MALVRGKFGLEYDPRQREEKTPPVVGWLIALVAVGALISLITAFVSRVSAEKRDEAPPSEATAIAVHPESPPAAENDANARPLVQSPAKRPLRLRNLLLRLDEAKKKKDIEMEASTIEQIRDLSGSPAADLDDVLARRLGTLNMRRLFVNRNPQWVKAVTVRSELQVSRLAAEHGSTVASFARLNGGKARGFRAGEKVYVLEYPRFNLVIHRRARVADLLMREKFFKRYDLSAPVTGEVGQYETSANLVDQLKNLGLALKPEALAELKLLLPEGSMLTIAEM